MTTSKKKIREIIFAYKIEFRIGNFAFYARVMPVQIYAFHQKNNLGPH